MKKKTTIDPFTQLPSLSNGVKKKIKEIFDGPKVDYNAPPVRIKDDVSDKYIINLEKLDDWCAKWLDENKDIKRFKSEYYPYKDYTAIDELLRKNGKEFIARLLKECPLKGRELKNDIYDSIAFSIYKKRVDPKSLFVVPDHSSFWDRISDRGHV